MFDEEDDDEREEGRKGPPSPPPYPPFSLPQVAICTRSELEDFLSEAVCMKEFDHPNVMRLIGEGGADLGGSTGPIEATPEGRPLPLALGRSNL